MDRTSQSAKERIRLWLQDRQRCGLPLPPLDKIRADVWGGADQERSDRAIPEAKP